MPLPNPSITAELVMAVCWLFSISSLALSLGGFYLRYHRMVEPGSSGSIDLDDLTHLLALLGLFAAVGFVQAILQHADPVIRGPELDGPLRDPGLSAEFRIGLNLSFFFVLWNVKLSLMGLANRTWSSERPRPCFGIQLKMIWRIIATFIFLAFWPVAFGAVSRCASFKSMPYAEACMQHIFLARCHYIYACALVLVTDMCGMFSDGEIVRLMVRMWADTLLVVWMISWVFASMSKRGLCLLAIFAMMAVSMILDILRSIHGFEDANMLTLVLFYVLEMNVALYLACLPVYCPQLRNKRQVHEPACPENQSSPSQSYYNAAAFSPPHRTRSLGRGAMRNAFEMRNSPRHRNGGFDGSEVRPGNKGITVTHDFSVHSESRATMSNENLNWNERNPEWLVGVEPAHMV